MKKILSCLLLLSASAHAEYIGYEETSIIPLGKIKTDYHLASNSSVNFGIYRFRESSEGTFKEEIKSFYYESDQFVELQSSEMIRPHSLVKLFPNAVTLIGKLITPTQLLLKITYAHIDEVTDKRIFLSQIFIVKKNPHLKEYQLFDYSGKPVKTITVKIQTNWLGVPKGIAGLEASSN